MILPIYKIIKANRSLEELISQQTLYNINIAYKIYKIKKELDEIENYTFSRLNIICPNINIENMNENEIILYNTILNSTISIDIPILTKDELLSNNEIKLTVEDIENILTLFNENDK